MNDKPTELAGLDKTMMEAVEAMVGDAHLAETRDPDGWVIEWYMKRLVELGAAEQAIKDHVQLLLNQIKASRRGLEWKWGMMFRSESERRLKAQKGKSFLTPFGRIGKRSTGGKPTLVIDDEQQALAAAQFLCPDAIKRSLLKEPLKEYAAQGKAIAGTHMETPPQHDVFYAGETTFGEQTLEGTETPLLEGESDGTQD